MNSVDKNALVLKSLEEQRKRALLRSVVVEEERREETSRKKKEIAGYIYDEEKGRYFPKSVLKDVVYVRMRRTNNGIEWEGEEDEKEWHWKSALPVPLAVDGWQGWKEWEKMG